MKFAHATLTKGAIWTAASFGSYQVIRFSTNVVLTRLLAPELFGIMVIVYTFRTGVELISDVGITQSIIFNKNAEEPDFYQTAWTLQSLRGLVLWLIACTAAAPIANFYQTPILAFIIPVASFIIVLTGFTSIGPTLLQKRLQFAKLTVYEIAVGTISAFGQVALAYFIPTIWGLVYGLLFAGTAMMAGSYFLLPEIEHRFKISIRYVWNILHIGKWIFLTSLIYFLSISFDRLYLAGAIPLAMLGVYGIARNISELLSTLALKMGNSVIFPFIAKHSEMLRDDLHSQLDSIRLRFLLIAAIGFSFSAAAVDLAIRFIFDQRYHAAGWMASVLIIGAWNSILCSLNESTLLGIGKPHYSTIGYSLKFIWLLVGLPLSFSHYGPAGSIILIATSDVFRYITLLVGQIRERFAYGLQDFQVTLIMLSFFGVLEWLRWFVGLGTSFATLPI